MSYASFAVIGFGLVVLGAGLGIGMIGGKALEGIARQPEQVGNLRSVGILFAALIEGLAFVAVIIGFVIANKG